LVWRDEITTALIELDPGAHRARQTPFKRTHGKNFITPGPDSLWAIDGHHKLTRWGFEIYAAIDAYSRKIIWAYVGVDAVTSISVAKQYLDTIKRTGVIPYRLRADRGSETPIIGDIQYELRRQTEFFNGEILQHEIEDFPFDQAFLFGTSMKNQRIESWWRLLQTGALRPWRVCSIYHTRTQANHPCVQEWFRFMEREVKWDKKNVADQVVILFLLMPIIRHQVETYVLDWNAHTIRKQRDKPHIISGVPNTIYAYPEEGVHQYGEQPHQATFDQICQVVEDQSMYN
jgi:hypothetical protein